MVDVKGDRNMGDINKLIDEGFLLHKQPWKIHDLAFMSLKIALKAYLSTYQTMKYSLDIFDGKHANKSIDLNHWPEYFIACSETIVHFQHFTELIIKDLLRKKHELLALDASREHDIFYRLLQGEQVEPIDYEKLKSVEFSLALERFCELVKKGRLDEKQFDFILQAKGWLVQLNNLRNRLWHRGSYILRYNALDQLVGERILPFLLNVVALPDYIDNEQFWKYGILSSSIDPIQEIINHFKSGDKFNIGKVAFLKELGRASFKNPLTMSYEYCDNQHRAEKMAEIESNGPRGNRIIVCPVCGTRSLVVFDDFDVDGPNPDGAYKIVSRFNWEVKCSCCSFTINCFLENPCGYGYDFIEDFWEE